MAIFGGHLDWVLVIFLVLVFAEYVKVRAKSAKGFGLIGGAAIWFLLAASFTGLGFMAAIGPAALYGQFFF